MKTPTCKLHLIALILLIAVFGFQSPGVAADNPYFGTGAPSAKATGFFRLSKTKDRHHLVTPDGRAYFALGVNHIDMLRMEGGGLVVNGNEAWQSYWQKTLEPRFTDWHLTTFGYGAPGPLLKKAPWFGSLAIAPIEKHKSDPRPGVPGSYQFPDVFDPAWVKEVTERVTAYAAPWRDDPMLIGYFWTDTPTWDLFKTRALRGTDWVSATRAQPASAAGRQAYAAFIEKRYAGRLDELNTIYGLALTSLDQLRTADLTRIAIGRPTVQEDDEAFLEQIALRYYETVGKAQRQADPNHLVFGDRYLAGDAPAFVLKAATPWIDAVGVQPGDRYSPQYPPSTKFPETDIDLLHTLTGKPVLVCDHAISFPTAEHPVTIFEQMPDEAAAVQATADFLLATFAKNYTLGYLRCQYIDRPSGFGRGLRQGLLKPDGTPREAMVRVYREGFDAALQQLKSLAP